MQTLTEQLAELSELKDGWLDGGGIAPDKGLLKCLGKKFDRHYPDHLPVPRAYPMPNGGVQLEWYIAGIDVSLSITSLAKAHWHCLDTESGDSIDDCFDLRRDSELDALTRELTAFCEREVSDV